MVPSAARFHLGPPPTGQLHASLPGHGFVPQCQRHPAPPMLEVIPPQKGWDPQPPRLVIQGLNPSWQARAGLFPGPAWKPPPGKEAGRGE